MIQRLDRHTDPEPVWAALQRAEGLLAYDVGTNIGQSTRVLAKRFAKVVAFEPCVESYEILAKEMARDLQDDRVLALCLAVSSKDGELELQEAERSVGTGQLVSHEGLHWGPLVGSRTVPARTLDSLVLEHGVPDFVKIDTEGHEVQVVEGGTALFGESHPPVIVEVHRRENEAPLRALLADYDLVKVEHTQLRVESPIRLDHFWLLSKELT